jgi:outer membrane receptor protein involved in Fe transport
MAAATLSAQDDSTQHSALSTQHSSDTITVTATRTETRLSDTPSSVVVLNRDTINASAATTVDDALRQVPGFTLFRRSGSRSANPTSQGVSLRGIGASGASRAIVLDDGVPLNDPFGGWVYWGRIPRASLDRVEILRGGASDLYGSGAMSGVVQFVRRRDSTTVVDVSGGSERTGQASIYTAWSAGAPVGEGADATWRGSFAADLLTTNGYVLVEPRSRGAVDVNADARHSSFDATAGRGGIFVRASHYDESRNNGTPLQKNDTQMTQLAAGADLGSLILRAYGSDQNYAQTFSSIAADRNSERLTVDQRVPSRSRGGSALYAHAFGLHNAFVGGIEARDVSGVSDETQPASHTRAGGHQRSSSAFLQDIIETSARLSITAALRFDDWRNDDAFRNSTPLASRHDTSWSPRLAMIVRATDRLSLTASAYRAFRAPTLNELYRSFRVGNVLTNANESLGPERLSAFEVGARFANVRVTTFEMKVDDTIANVTLSTTPSLITRQRRNLGSSRTRGVEIESDWRVADHLRVSAGYLMSDARVVGGKRLPQVPRNQATLQTIFTPLRGTIALQARWSAMQFDDDLNRFPLRSYAAADLFASVPLRANVALTLSAENLFDRRIEVSATPVITLNAPRTVRLGLRVEVGGNRLQARRPSNP